MFPLCFWITEALCCHRCSATTGMLLQYTVTATISKIRKRHPAGCHRFSALTYALARNRSVIAAQSMAGSVATLLEAALQLQLCAYSTQNRHFLPCRWFGCSSFGSSGRLGGHHHRRQRCSCNSSDRHDGQQRGRCQHDCGLWLLRRASHRRSHVPSHWYGLPNALDTSLTCPWCFEHVDR